MVQVAAHPGRDHSQVAVPFAHVPAEAQRRDVGERVHRHLENRRARSIGDAGVFPLGGGVHEGDHPPRVGATRNLGRTQDRGMGGLVDEGPRAAGRGWRSDRACRTLPDPPGIEEAQPFEPAEAEETRPLDEEGTPLLEEGLEGGQVHHRGVGLHLAEVGVDGGVQGESAGETVLQVEPHRTAVHRAVVEGACRVGALVVAGAGDRIWKDFKTFGPAHALQSQQVSEQRGQPGFRGRPPRPVHRLARMKDVTAEVDSPDLAGALPEAELREGNAHLRNPAERVHLRRGVPDRIPSRVHPFESVVGRDQVVATSRRCHPEDEGGAVIVVRVELDQEHVVRLHERVAPTTQQGDP